MIKTYGRCPKCGVLWDREDMICPDCNIPLKPEKHRTVYNPR